MMSRENSGREKRAGTERGKSGGKRPYRQKARARQQEETRRRIVEAVVDLHRTVGPANTTISDVAELAGVGRMTVYKHFPNDIDLFAACGAHWSAENPMPDFDDCLARDALEDRCLCVLQRLYHYYRGGHDMLGKIMRDAPSLPALQAVLDENWMPAIRALEEALVPKELSPARGRQVAAVIALVLDLHTWERLTERCSDDAAARLATQLVLAADAGTGE